MSESEVDVLVVGAGPVGLSTALFLACHGVQTMVVDQRTSTFPHHRAGTSLRTLEIFRSLGLGAQLQRLGWETWGPLRAVVKDSAFGAELARIDLPDRYAQRLRTISPIRSRLVPQDELEALVLSELSRRGVPIQFTTRVTDIDAGADSVGAQLVDTGSGQATHIEAKYLVGCDGAHSDVRGWIGADMPGREVVGYPNTAFYRADLGDIVQRWRSHFCFVRNPQVYATVASFNGRDLWSSHLMDYPGKPTGRAELSHEHTMRLLRAAIGDDTLPIELLAVNSWEAALGISSTFRDGRIFLAGDAAHVQTSAGGLGMNTGIQDGHNLAWKLAAVLHSHADPGVLDSYEPERRAAAQASLALSSALSRGFRDRQADPGAWYEQIAVDYLRAMMFYRYRSPAILDDEPPTPETVLLDDVARPGYRLPHQWLDPDATLSTVDLTGTGWLLLTGPDRTAWQQAAATVEQASTMPLPAHSLTRTTSAAVGLEPAGALLVRPDGFVAWHTTKPGTDPVTALRDALHTILHPPRVPSA
jgi:tetracenomycin A2 monooxygenase-dioxygenase